MGKFGDSTSNKYCSVPQCKSRCTNEISLVPFPKEESQRKKWADAIKIEKNITEHMRVCSRHFVKNDYILSDHSKVRRLKKSAVPSQNLPWQFPNKRVSPTLAKARMERLKNRTQQKISESPDSKTEPSATNKSEVTKKPETPPETEKESPKKNDTTEVDEEKISTENVTVDIKLEEEEIEKLKEEAELEDNNEDVDAPEELDEAPEAKKEEKKDDMPARAPTRLRQRKGVIKCEYCGRKCLTPQALQTHQQIAHKNARNNQNNTKKESTVNNKDKSSPKPVPVALISVRSPESLQQIPIETEPAKTNKGAEKSINESELVEKVLQDSDSTDTTSGSDNEKEVANKVERKDKRKVDFECPKCKRRFGVYFMAVNHIQKHHSTAPNGTKVPKQLLPKPTRIEICTSCSMTLDTDVHVCTGPLKLALGFICTGCEQEYKTLTLFDMHKSSMHSDGVESMFFPTLDEFELWKQKMEIQTRAKYSILDQNDSKKIHRCRHRVVLGTGAHSRQRMCPSTIIVQEFTKGFQVHYYPIHYDHDFDRYGLGNAFKKYSITSLMNLAGTKPPDRSDEVQTETDLYLQFKKLTDVLVNEAARINVSGLKMLMRKALEMLNLVNSYVEDDDDAAPANSSIIKIDSNKDDLQDEVKSALLNLKRRPTETIEASLVKRRKSVFQSTENTPKTPKGLDDVQISNSFSLKDEIENECDKSPKKANQSSSFLDTFQDFVGKTTDRRVKPVKRQSDGKKPNIKTKMGQFKPSPPKKSANSSPKSNAVSPRTSIASVKDIEYEVKEQENDCNILILKI